MSPLNQSGTGNIMDKIAGSDLLGKVTEFFGEVDPRLDKIKESVTADLESLKKSPNLESLAANMWKSTEEGLQKDLNELGVDDAKRTECVAVARKEWDNAIQPEQMGEILKSPEKSALDTYIANLENLPVLKEIIGSAEPKKKWELWLEALKKKIPGLGMIAAPILKLFGFKTEDEKTKKILSLLEDKKPAKAPAAGTAAPATAVETQEEVVELTEDETAVIQPLKDAGITMDPKFVKEDMAFLTEKGLDTKDKKIELTKNAVSDTGNTKRIFDAVKIRLGEPKAKSTQIRLLSVWKFEKELTPENVTKIIAAIPNVGVSQEKMVKFLAAARDLKEKPNAIDTMTEFA
jgi:hypothetical protein